MPITLRASKKRKIKTTPAAKARRLAYKLEHKAPAVRKKATLARKKYYKKNKAVLLKKSALTRKARKR